MCLCGGVIPIGFVGLQLATLLKGKHSQKWTAVIENHNNVTMSCRHELGPLECCRNRIDNHEQYRVSSSQSRKTQTRFPLFAATNIWCRHFPLQIPTCFYLVVDLDVPGQVRERRTNRWESRLPQWYMRVNKLDAVPGDGEVPITKKERNMAQKLADKCNCQMCTRWSRQLCLTNLTEGRPCPCLSDKYLFHLYSSEKKNDGKNYGFIITTTSHRRWREEKKREMW